MIINYQPFLNELDLLEIKLRTLGSAADIHLVTECDMTFTGINKPLYFAENQSRFSNFPIKYVELEDPWKNLAPWDREWRQRQLGLAAIVGILAKYPNDSHIILWTDTDETIKPDVIQRFATYPGRPTHGNLSCDFLRFSFSTWANRTWDYPRITRCKGAAVVEPPRADFVNIPTLKDCGWHFEYFGGRDMLLEKINATSHASENGPSKTGVGTRAFWQNTRKGFLPPHETLTPYPFDRLPKSVREDRQRYEHLFTPAGLRPK